MSVETLTPTEAQLPPQKTPEPTGFEFAAAQQEVEEIALQFSPRVEVDDQGLTRTIFEYQGKTFSFQGRDETPEYPTVESSRPTYLGHESFWLTHPSKINPPEFDEAEVEYFKDAGWTDEQLQTKHEEEVAEWQAEHDRLTTFKDNLHKMQEANSESAEHFLVERSPLGIYSLMQRLQPENPRWKTEAEAVANNKYDDDTLILIDMVTAVNGLVVNKWGEDIEGHPPLGEAVVVAALLGDEKARDTVLAAAKYQEEKETTERDEALASNIAWANGEFIRPVEAFKPEDLVVVHATGYEPQLSEDGYMVQTTHDATGYPRSTVHTAINHVVESHMFGNWDSKDYVLITGLDKMIEKNGGPNSSNGADTWWTRNPGEKLDFPEGTLIAPGGSQTELVVRDGSRISYKSEGFTQDDVSSLGARLQQQIEAALHDGDESIEITSDTGQHIIANILRDSLVRKEITETRGKEWLDQSDDKFMSVENGQKLGKLYAELGLSIPAGLHNGGSQEGWFEGKVGQGKNTTFGGNYDPKIRRVAYASGLMPGGGEDRQRYIQRKAGDGF